MIKLLLGALSSEYDSHGTLALFSLECGPKADSLSPRVQTSAAANALSALPCTSVLYPVLDKFDPLLVQ